MDKFGRNYILYVQTRDGDTLEITPPLTIEFDITRNTNSSVNTSSIRVFNLSKQHRSRLVKNSFDWDGLRDITLMAGYGNNMSIVFKGHISEASNVREGTEYITDIQSFDGGFAATNGIINEQFTPGFSQVSIIDSIIAQLPGVTSGAVGSFPGNTSRSTSYSGNPVSILTEITGGAFYIDNGKAYCLGDSECLAGQVMVIDATTGLIGTPRIEQTNLYFDVVFEPRVYLSQQVKLTSTTADYFNRIYKITSIHHRGMISEAVCGEAVTTIGVLYGPHGLLAVSPS